MNFNFGLVAVLAISVIGALVGGCGPDNSKPQSIASPQEVNNIVEMRKMFDSVQGDWNKLTPDQQAQYNKLAGDPAKGKTLWDHMAHPSGPGAGPR
jgi:hypothetical protein